MGETILGQQVHLVPGGKGTNQAVALARMENMFLGREFRLGKTNIINWSRMYRESKRYLEQLGMELDP